MVAEDSLLNWCKEIDALGQVYMDEFRIDCAKYIVQHNKKFQLRLNEQNFFGLFLGGILKHDKPNMAWHTMSSPSRKPRSDTFTELIECGLRKLTREFEDRSQAIFGEILIMFACAENASASPAPGGGGGNGGGGAQINLRLPPSPANVTQGTLLQLGGAAGGGGGWPRSAMAPSSHYGPPSDAMGGKDRKLGFSQLEQATVLPPEPRYAEIAHRNDLMSAGDIRSFGVVELFKSEPLLAGECAALLMKDIGCIFPSCSYCKKTLLELPKTDTCDLLSALRRCMGSASARSRSGTPRGRSDSVGSDRSVGSQRSDGGGNKPKRPRQ